MRITLRQSAGLTVAALMGLVGLWYCYLILDHQIEPVLSSWLLFFIASSLGLWTYFKAKRSDRSAITNMANTSDVFVTGSVLACLALFGRDIRFGFNSFEWVCFGIAGAILLYHLIRHDGRTANIAVNGLLVLGYLPTIAHLWTADHNTESFALWLVVLIAAMIALYNPIKEKDFLATLYASRAVVLVGIILALMIRIWMR